MKEQVINSLAEALDMDASEISTEHEFRQYKNYSSLTELSVLAMLSEYGIELEMAQYKKYKTVSDLINLISKTK